MYIRTAIAMIVAFVVTRMLLKELGEENYGLYNVVAGVVILFSFLNASMSQAIQRFITFSLGKDNLRQTTKVFSTCFQSQLFITIGLILICETFGVWFINTKVDTGIVGLKVANQAFQLSIFTFAISFIKVPYESTIIAYEKMSFFAYATIIDSLLKLGLVFLLGLSSQNKLVLYCLLLLLESAIMLLVYYVYCKVNFSICKLSTKFDKPLFSEIMRFSSWNVLGSISNIISQKGIVFLLNIYVGLIANAAMGIASQINSALTSFINSFQSSFRPQIVKAYASQEESYLQSMICSTSKFSFLLVFIPSLFLVLNMPIILHLWLTEVPEYTVSFGRLIIICCVIDALSGPYNCAILATGNIKKYQLLLTLSSIIELSFYYIILISFISVKYILWGRIISRGILNMFIGLYCLKKQLYFSIKKYIYKVLIPLFKLMLICIPCIYLLRGIAWRVSFLLSSALFVFLICPLIAIFLVMTKEERSFFKFLLSRKK